MPQQRPRRYTNTCCCIQRLGSTERNMPHKSIHTYTQRGMLALWPSTKLSEGRGEKGEPFFSWLMPLESALHLSHSSTCLGEACWHLRRNACACVYAHTCVGLSAPSAADSLVYSNSTLRPKLLPCWPPKPACLFQPHWPPMRELGREEPPPHPG